MGSQKLILLAVGDLILDMPETESYFALSAPMLKSADVVVGHGEVPYTTKGVNTYTDVPAPPSDPKHLRALPYAGFNVITLAGNHVWDAGTPGIEDHITELQKYGIAYTGAGMNIEEARKPALIERRGTRFGFLSYNCVGPKASWARPDKPGCAYVHILTHVEVPDFGPLATYTFAEPNSLKALISDIKGLRPLCDVLVVALHKGVGHVPAEIAMYDQQVSYAAIDAGADLIVGHHAHLLKGIELYKGKTIFHGLCNFVAVTLCLWPEHAPTLKLREHAVRRQKYFPLDPEYPTYPFHPDARKTIIAKCIVEDGQITRICYLPCLVNKKGQPEILKHGERGQEVFDYMEKITREAGLNARFEWEGDEVVIHAD